MLYNPKSAKKKLHLAYRGLFVVTSFGSDYEKLYTLRQVEGTAISHIFYSDYLKLF